MHILVRAIGLFLIVAALAQWREAVQAEPGEFSVVVGFALPLAWGITGYGLVRLREWGRQLMVLTCATWLVLAVVAMVVERSVSSQTFSALLLGVNLGVLFLLKRITSITRDRPLSDDAEPAIEGVLAAVASLITFGAVWFMVLFPLTKWLWDWFWGLSGSGKFMMFFFAGGYFIGLVYFTLFVPFIVATYFHGLARGGVSASMVTHSDADA